MNRNGVVGVLSLSLAAFGCNGDDADQADPGELPHEQDTHWAYSGAEGPEYWGELSEDFALCSSGAQQSPVDFPEELVPSELGHLEFDYAETPALLINNGHTIVVEPDEDSNQLLVDGEAHTLLQFHFHAQSEHQVGGQAYPLEMHLVHRSADGDLAVIGVFIDEGATNEALAEVFANMAASSEDPLLLDSDLNLAALLPDERMGWSYPGSLTTPPCTEGVKWNVHATPITASATQLKAFSDLHAGSYRPVGDNTHIDEQLAELDQD